MRIDVTLRGERAEQFRRIETKVEERLGHEPTRAQVLGYLMAEFEAGDDDGETQVLP